jgi:hypothetical protein
VDPKLFRFGIINASLGLDASECCYHLPHMLSGRCQLSELVELDELYVVERTYTDPTGRSWYRTA